jgi:hypothetical protein
MIAIFRAHLVVVCPSAAQSTDKECFMNSTLAGTMRFLQAVSARGDGVVRRSAHAAFLLLALLHATAAMAGSISGQVKDADGNNVQGATVEVSGPCVDTGTTATTNANGSFTVTWTCPPGGDTSPCNVILTVTYPDGTVIAQTTAMAQCNGNITQYQFNPNNKMNVLCPDGTVWGVFKVRKYHAQGAGVKIEACFEKQNPCPCCTDFRYFQVVVEDTNPLNYNNMPLMPPYVDPPNGGYDGQPFDNDPWYNEAGRNGPNCNFPYYLFDRPSKPSPGMQTVRFETWLVCVQGGNVICGLKVLRWGFSTNNGVVTKVFDLDYGPSALTDAQIKGALNRSGFGNWTFSRECSWNLTVTDCVRSNTPGTYFSSSIWTRDAVPIGETFPGGIVPPPGPPVYDTKPVPVRPNDWHWYVNYQWNGLPTTMVVWVDNIPANATVEVKIICSQFFVPTGLMLHVDVANNHYALTTQKGQPIWQGPWSQYPNDIPPSLGFSVTGDVRQNGQPCPGDIAPPGGNGVVNIDDLFLVIGSWGPCPPTGQCRADVSPPPNGDGVVNIDDLFLIIARWGPCN